MTQYLFDTPYWLLALVVVIGVALLISANARQEKRLGWAGALVLFVGALLALLSFFIETDKEKVRQRTKELAAAVEKKDTRALDRLLHPGANLAGSPLTKAELLEMIPRQVDRYQISNIRVSPEDPRQLSSGVIEITATITADARGAGAAGNSPTDWQFAWVKTPDGWRLKDIRPLKLTIGNVDLQSLISRGLR
jgi:flagellar biosynthesis protein FliQ